MIKLYIYVVFMIQIILIYGECKCAKGAASSEKREEKVEKVIGQNISHPSNTSTINDSDAIVFPHNENDFESRDDIMANNLTVSTINEPTIINQFYNKSSNGDYFMNISLSDGTVRTEHGEYVYRNGIKKFFIYGLFTHKGENGTITRTLYTMDHRGIVVIPVESLEEPTDISIDSFFGPTDCSSDSTSPSCVDPAVIKLLVG